MRIESVRIENFRSFKDIQVPFNRYVCLVGPNGAGKSTVLTALNVFFGHTEGTQTNLRELEEEDFHLKNTTDPIKITVTFTDLNNEAKENLSHYVRQEKLVVMARAKFDSETGKASVEHYGYRLVIEDFKSFFEAEKAKKRVEELKSIYNEIRKKYPKLPVESTKQKMKSSLREFEEKNPDQCTLIQSMDQFYGFSKGANHLENYIHWVYVPAVKDATSEQVEAKSSALEKLLKRTVHMNSNLPDQISELHEKMQDQYDSIITKNQTSLVDISSKLQDSLTEWAHPNTKIDLEWRQNHEKSIRVEEPLAHVRISEGVFNGTVARFGHGLQRSFLLALLQVIANLENTSSSSLILACEEPELYQHPPQVSHLADTLNTLTQGNTNTQVIVSTHNPHLITGQGFEDVRMFRMNYNENYSEVFHTSFDKMSVTLGDFNDRRLVRPEGILAKIHQALQSPLKEMFFTQRLILVEGLEDIAYLQTYLHLLEQEKKFRRLGGHIVAANGKSQLLQPLVIAKHLKIPTYVVFDADADCKRQEQKTIHENDNRKLLKQLGKPELCPMPKKRSYSELGFTMWHSNIGDIVKEDIGNSEWQKYRSKADDQYGHAGNLSKNSLHIAASLNYAWEDGKYSKNLKCLCKSILDPDNFI